MIPVFRLQMVKEKEIEAIQIHHPADIISLVGDEAMADREQLICLYLNTKNWPIGRQTVSVGSLNSSLWHPRELIKGAILANAATFILVHNHPSGDPTPSNEDDQVTARAARAGEAVGISLLDHVIISPTGSHFSYHEKRPNILRLETPLNIQYNNP